jgi:uncharacterized protein YegP (UPF0339 family)
MKRAISWIIVILVVFAAAWSTAGFQSARAADAEKKAGTAKFEVYKDRGGEYRWRLRTQNKNVIASSGQGYASKQACLDGIESVKKNAADAAVEQVEEKEGDKGKSE